MLRNPNPEILPSFNEDEILPSFNEDEFLPPVSQWTILGGIFLVSTVVLAFTVSAFTPLPVTVKAPAIVRPNGEVKIVQSHLEASVVSIKVKENQTVTQGSTLVILDAFRFNTRQGQLRSNLQQNRQQLQEITEQLRNLTLQLTAETDKINRVIAVANADYSRLNKEYQEKRLTIHAQINEARANIQIAQEDLAKSQSDIKASEAAVRASKSALRITQQKLERYQNVSQSGSLPLNQLEEAQLAVEQQHESVIERTALLQSQKQTMMRQLKAVESAEARLQGVLATINPSNGLVTMGKEKIAQEKAIGKGNIARLNQERSSLLQRQSELQKQIENDNQELLQVKRDISKMIIVAPISGIILKLNLRNANQTVRLGEEIAQIAPSNTPLVIKAKVSTQDIGKVKLQQKVQMRVTAFPYPDFGILTGKVISISPDAITPQNTGNTPVLPYYEVTIKPDQLSLKDDPKNALQSGMEMQTDIIAKDETVLKFILRKARILTNL